ncbi:unnamed protein product [Heterobilharzia americana]|nr:unnamed protein product [Heterobilharzia americana]
MPWLEWSDYPIFLGCADLGISIHRSSSGLDLPMKVVDLFGVNVPVLALGYPTLDELMKGNSYGLCFETSHQLAEQMCNLLKPSQIRIDENVEESSRFLSVGSEKLFEFRKSIKRRNNSIDGYLPTGKPPYFQSLKTSQLTHVKIKHINQEL